MDNAYQGPERRQFLRVEVEFFVTYKVDRPVEVHAWISNKEINALMLDLSEAGMAIVTNCDIPTATVLSLKFTLIDLHADQEKQVKLINMTGEVCNSTLVENDEHRLGISFTEISEEDKSAIADFVKMAMKR